MAAGCAGFRAQVGVGAGFGASAHIPGLIKTSIGFGTFVHVGHEYGEGWVAGNPDSGLAWDNEVGIGLAYYEFESRELEPIGYGFGRLGAVGNPRFLSQSKANAFGCAISPFLNWGDDTPGGSRMAYHAPWSLEVDLQLLLISIRLGFNHSYYSPPAEYPAPKAIGTSTTPEAEGRP